MVHRFVLSLLAVLLAGSATRIASAADGCPSAAADAVVPGAVTGTLTRIGASVVGCDQPQDFSRAGWGACERGALRPEIETYYRSCVIPRERAEDRELDRQLLRRTQLLVLFSRELDEISRLNPEVEAYASRWDAFEARWKDLLKRDPGGLADASGSLPASERGALAQRVAAIPKLREERRAEYRKLFEEQGLGKPHLARLLSSALVLESLDWPEARQDAARVAALENQRLAGLASSAQARVPRLSAEDVLRQRRDSIYRETPELLMSPALARRARALMRPYLTDSSAREQLYGGRDAEERFGKLAADPDVAQAAAQFGNVAAFQSLESELAQIAVNNALGSAVSTGPGRAPALARGLDTLDRMFLEANDRIHAQRDGALDGEAKSLDALIADPELPFMTVDGLASPEDPVAQRLIARRCVSSWAEKKSDAHWRTWIVVGGTLAVITGIGALGLGLGALGVGAYAAIAGGSGWAATTAGVLGAGAMYASYGALVAGSLVGVADVGQAYGKYHRAENRFYARLANYGDVRSASGELNEALAYTALTVGSGAAPAAGQLLAMPARLAAGGGRAVAGGVRVAEGRAMALAEERAVGAAGERAAAPVDARTAVSEVRAADGPGGWRVGAARAAALANVGINGAIAYENIEQRNYWGLGFQAVGLGIGVGSARLAR